MKLRILFIFTVLLFTGCFLTGNDETSENTEKHNSPPEVMHETPLAKGTNLDMPRSLYLQIRFLLTKFNCEKDGDRVYTPDYQCVERLPPCENGNERDYALGCDYCEISGLRYPLGSHQCEWGILH